MTDIKFPLMTFVSDGTIHAMQYIEETIERLRQVSGYSIEELIQKFAMGYTLEGPKNTNMSLKEMAETEGL